MQVPSPSPTEAPVSRAPSALEPPLLDAQGRRMSYLRLSVTDRCNLRCTYCSPASWGGKRDLLTAEELARIASVFAQLGIERVRLTGGEPLARPDLEEIARRLRALPGIRRIALTTNATLLAGRAEALREAGVDQLNISLDTLREETFQRISKVGSLAEILEGIDAACRAGFESVKLNVVVMAGVNDGECAALIAYAHARGITPRFIELMPFGSGKPVATRALLESLRAQGVALEAEVDEGPRGAVGPARYYRCDTGRVGFISPMTENFCGGCNRVRVAANGDLRSCLGGREQAPLHALIRGGASDLELAVAIRRALGQKQEGHRFTEPEAAKDLLSMMGIGG
jgi:cyclic pyranopterin phosphate synthase